VICGDLQFSGRPSQRVRELWLLELAPETFVPSNICSFPRTFPHWNTGQQFIDHY